MDLFTHLSVFLVESATWLVISEERAGLRHEHGEAKESTTICNNEANSQSQNLRAKMVD